MEIKLPTKQLNSTRFRVLFELAKEEGPEALQKLLSELKMIERQHSLGHEAIFRGEHSTLSLTRRNKSVIAYLREHKNELTGIYLLSDDINSAITSLVENPSLLDTYIETARTLESYRVGNINVLSNNVNGVNIKSQVFYNKDGQIIHITKHYTDGFIIYLPLEEPQERYNRQIINCDLDTSVSTTWVLRTENTDTGWQYRTISIKDFAIDTSKLPSEEEIQSYDFPPSLKLYLGK